MKIVSTSAQAETQLESSKRQLAEIPAKIKAAIEVGDIKTLTRLRQFQSELSDTINAQEIIVARFRLNEAESERLKLVEQLQEAEQTQLKAQQVNTRIQDELDKAARLYNLSTLERVSIENRLKQKANDIRDARRELESLIQRHSEAA